MAIQVLGTGETDGTSIVRATTEKVHLYGGTGVVQAATIANAVAATGVSSVTVSGTAATCPCSNADHAALVAIINTLLDDLSDLGINASA